MSAQTAEDPVMRKVKLALLADAGANGLRAAITTFRSMDVNADHTLSPQEFRSGLFSRGVTLSDFELRHIVKSFDKNNDGMVTLDEFLHGLLGSLNTRRRAVISKAYAHLTKNTSALRAQDLLQAFAAHEHPAVVQGVSSEADIRGELSGAFGVDANNDGIVSQEEFQGFFAGMSAVTPSDDVFETMMLRCFGMDDSTRPKLDSTARKWDENGDPLALKPQRLPDAFSATLHGPPGKGYDVNQSKRPFKEVPPIGKVVKREWTTTNRRDYPDYAAEDRKKAVPDGVANKPSMTGDPIVDSVRSRILARAGDEGFVGLQRAFRLIDKDKDTNLDAEEVLRGLKRIRVDLSVGEHAHVMEYLDRNSNGKVTVTEFLRGIRGPLTNPSRINIILEAFQRLDSDSSGIVSLQEIAPRYDTSRHPAVVAGKKTPQEVIQEFIGDWDSNRDGNVTLAEWNDYYANLSAGIDSDQYFELMIRNAWHISGGTGAAQNTTCRRVCAKFADGSQKVLEIKNDLGLKGDDIPEMKRRLEAQGHTGIVEIKLSM